MKKLFCIALALLCLLLSCSAALAMENYDIFTPRETADEIILMFNFVAENYFEDALPFDTVLEEDDYGITFGTADGLTTCAISYSPMDMGVSSVALTTRHLGMSLVCTNQMFELVYNFFGDDGAVMNWFNEDCSALLLALLQDGETGVVTYSMQGAVLEVETLMAGDEPMVIVSIDCEYGLMVY